MMSAISEMHPKDTAARRKRTNHGFTERWMRAYRHRSRPRSVTSVGLSRSIVTIRGVVLAFVGAVAISRARRRGLDQDVRLVPRTMVAHDAVAQNKQPTRAGATRQ